MSVRRGRTSSRARRCERSGRRVLGIVTLAGLDALGLALGLYAALLIRNVVYGDEVFWSLLWETGPRSGCRSSSRSPGSSSGRRASMRPASGAAASAASPRR